VGGNLIWEKRMGVASDRQENGGGKKAAWTGNGEGENFQGGLTQPGIVQPERNPQRGAEKIKSGGRGPKSPYEINNWKRSVGSGEGKTWGGRRREHAGSIGHPG